MTATTVSSPNTQPRADAAQAGGCGGHGLRGVADAAASSASSTGNRPVLPVAIARPPQPVSSAASVAVYQPVTTPPQLPPPLRPCAPVAQSAAPFRARAQASSQAVWSTGGAAGAPAGVPSATFNPPFGIPDADDEWDAVFSPSDVFAAPSPAATPTTPAPASADSAAPVRRTWRRLPRHAEMHASGTPVVGSTVSLPVSVACKPGKRVRSARPAVMDFNPLSAQSHTVPRPAPLVLRPASEFRWHAPGGDCVGAGAGAGAGPAADATAVGSAAAAAAAAADSPSVSNASTVTTDSVADNASPSAATPSPTPNSKRQRRSNRHRVRFSECVKPHDGLSPANALLDRLVWQMCTTSTIHNGQHLMDAVDSVPNGRRLVPSVRALLLDLERRVAALPIPAATATAATTDADGDVVDVAASTSVPVLPGGGGTAAKLGRANLPRVSLLRALMDRVHVFLSITHRDAAQHPAADTVSAKPTAVAPADGCSVGVDTAGCHTPTVSCL